MQILQQTISIAELKELAQSTFGDMIKCVANIGSETSRVLKALEAGKENRAQSAFARFRDLYCAAFLEKKLPELAAANRYLDHFASIR